MMRAALWFTGLFALAVAIALFAGSNQGVVSLFWGEYRIDASVNMALLVLLAFFALLHASLRGLALAGQPSRSSRQQTLQPQPAHALHSCTTPTQLLALWAQLPIHQRQQPALALAAAQHWLALQGSPQQALQWLQPLFKQFCRQQLPAPQQAALWQTLGQCQAGLPGRWQQRLQRAQQHQPEHPGLACLLGLAYAQPGSTQQIPQAQALLERSLPALDQQPALQALAWSQLATLAQQRQDSNAALAAWQAAAQAGQRALVLGASSPL
ncbi:MAG: hypothetical protein KIG95_10965 [Comamonas sp.]|nr:hypothetical protein [Comamonas sp.]